MSSVHQICVIYWIWYGCRWFSKLIEKLAGYFVISGCSVMLIVILLQVFFRYVIKSSIPWSEETARYLMIWIGFIGGSIAFRYGEFIGIETLRSKLTVNYQKILEIVISLCVILFLLFLVIFGIDFARRGEIQRTPVLRIKMIYAYMSIPFGAGFCLVHALYFLLDSLGLGKINSSKK